jgi:hypothetical protein
MHVASPPALWNTRQKDHLKTVENISILAQFWPTFHQAPKLVTREACQTQSPPQLSCLCMQLASMSSLICHINSSIVKSFMMQTGENCFTFCLWEIILGSLEDLPCLQRTYQISHYFLDQISHYMKSFLCTANIFFSCALHWDVLCELRPLTMVVALAFTL